MLGLSMEWTTCPDGVEHVRPEPTRKGLEEYLAIEEDPASRAYIERLLRGSEEEGEEVVAAGAVDWFRYRTARRRATSYRLDNLETPVVIDFMNARDTEAVTLFLSRYGLPVSGVDAISLSHLNTIRQELERSVTQLWNELDPAERVTVLNMQLSEADWAPVGPALELRPNSRSARLVFQPKTPAAFMLMEVAVAASVDARLGSCEHCGKWFLTGAQTGRRSHARFCSDRCRVAAMRKRKAQNDS